MSWAEFHFIRPFWLIALLPVIYLVIVFYKRRSSDAGWDGLIAPHLLQALMLGQSKHASRLPLLLLACAWLFAVGALAGPTWERLPQPVYQASIDQVVILDLSPSMTRTDVQPDRITRARFAVSDLLQQTP